MTSPAQPPGWYANPDGPGRRYWDGEQWTDSYAPDEPKKKRGGVFWKVTGAIVLGGLLLIVGCSALISAGLEEQQDENAITNAEYRSVKRGDPMRATLARLGEPESESKFADRASELRFDCRFWNLSEEAVGSFAQICFDEGRVRSKSQVKF